MAERHLLIGATGFLGRSLSQHLQKRGRIVLGTYHNTKPSQIHEKIKWIPCDVTNQKKMEQILSRIRPDVIYYLAGQSSVRKSWEETARTLDVNLMGGIYLLEWLRARKHASRTIIFSSGTVYGRSFLERARLLESDPLRPIDPYSVSKLAIDLLAQQYAKNYGVNVSIVRLCNVTGPGQSELFSIANFAKQIRNLHKGETAGKRSLGTITVGNLEAKRDFLDVEDAVSAIDAVRKRGKSGEVYNIASGKARRLGDILNTMLSLAGYDSSEVRISANRALMSRDEIPSVSLSNQKLCRDTGWKPKISFVDTLRKILLCG